MHFSDKIANNRCCDAHGSCRESASGIVGIELVGDDAVGVVIDDGGASFFL